MGAPPTPDGGGTPPRDPAKKEKGECKHLPPSQTPTTARRHHPQPASPVEIIPTRGFFLTFPLSFTERDLAVLAKMQLIWNDQCQYRRLTWGGRGGDEITSTLTEGARWWDDGKDLL